MNPQLQRRLPLVVVGLVVLALFALSVLDSGERSPRRAVGGETPVAVTRVMRADLRETYRTVGTVAGRSEVKIAAQSPGLLQEVSVRPGDRVARGQPLAALDDRILRADLAEAEAAFRRSSEELERVRKLAELDLAETRRVEAAIAQHAMDEAAVERLRTGLAQSGFPSPFDGVVTAQYAYPGDAVQSGSPILALADVTRLRVITKVPAAVAARLGAGAPAVLGNL